MFFHSCNGTNIFMRWKMKCSIQLGFILLNGTLHLSPHENICTIALINFHYLYTILHFILLYTWWSRWYRKYTFVQHISKMVCPARVLGRNSNKPVHLFRPICPKFNIKQYFSPSRGHWVKKNKQTKTRLLMQWVKQSELVSLSNLLNLSILPIQGVIYPSIGDAANSKRPLLIIPKVQLRLRITRRSATALARYPQNCNCACALPTEDRKKFFCG